jgi:small subunit ribosomal protein S6
LAAAETPEYELILMLDPEASDDRRQQIVAEARSRIEAGGNLKHDTGWGMRKLAYEIRQRTEADYRFFRFESDPPLLESLDHDLKIADGVLRFRIFNVDPRSPVIIPPAPTPGSGASRGQRRPGPGPRRGEEPAERAEPEAAAEPAPAAEPAGTEPADGGNAEPTADSAERS